MVGVLPKSGRKSGKHPEKALSAAFVKSAPPGSLRSNRFDAFESVSRDVRDRGLFIIRAHDYFHSTLQGLF